jgi:hypothetical protein
MGPYRSTGNRLIGQHTRSDIMKTTLLLCSMLALPLGSALAADSPWNGTWKLDPAQSHFTGDTFTLTKGKGNLLHYSDGSAASYDFGVDGKEYKTWSNRTAIWTPAGDNAWDTVIQADGKVLVKSHRQLSTDQKTLTMTFTGTRPDGTPFQDEAVYERVNGTTGLIGTWRSVKVSEPNAPREFVITSPAPGVVRYEVPDMKATAEGRTDGSDTPLTGPDVPPGSTISFKMLSPMKIRYVMKIKGETDSMGEQTLAADRHSFSDVNWNPGKENEKSTGVYLKQ